MCEDHKTHLSRRGFGTLALAGAAAGLVPARAFAAKAGSGPDPVEVIDTLAVMCIDYRLVHHAMRFFDGAHGPGPGAYDLVSLAGASLSTVARGHFRHTVPGFWQQVQGAWLLHKIKKIVVVDHMGCGAFRVEYNANRKPYPQERTDHIADMNRLRTQLPAKVQELGITHPLELQCWMFADPGLGPVPEPPERIF